MLLNKERADAFLENYSADALVSSSRENTTYLTNFLALSHIFTRMYNSMPGSGENFTQVYGVYPRNGRGSVLILPSSLFMIMKADEDVSEIVTYGKGISTEDQKPRFDTLAEEQFNEIMKDHRRNFGDAATALEFVLKDYVSGNKLAVDYSDMQATSISRLNSANYRTLRANELFRFLRMVKSPDEVSRLSKAAEINESGVESIFELVRRQRKKRRLNEADLEHEYLKRVSYLGGTSRAGYVMCPVGTRGGTMSAPTRTSRITSQKALFWVDASCCYKGYNADTGESGSLGRPSEKQKKYYEAVLDAVETCEQVIAPGMKPSELNAEATQVFERHGVARPPTGMGHGIGLEIYDYPRISAAKGDALDNQSAIKDDFIRSSIDIPFEEGMVLALEIPQLVWGWGGVHVEVTVLLEKSGSRRLVKGQRRHLRTL